MFEFSRGNYEQKSRQILEATRGLSSTNLEGTHLIECLRSTLKDVTEEMERLRQGWLAHWDTDVRFVMVYASEWVRLTNLTLESANEIERLRAERDEARRYSCDLEARIIMLEEDRRDTSNNFGTNPCSEIILPDYPLARDPKEIAKRKGWDCYKEETK